MGGRNRRRLLSLILLLALAPFSASAREVWIYVTDSGGDRVEKIDPTTNRIAQVIGGIALPHDIGFSPDGSQIYISNEAKNVLDIVDRASGQITDEAALSGRPNNIAVTKDGGRVLVAIRNGKGALDVIDTATRRLVKSILVNAPLHNVYVTPDGKYAIAGSIAGQMVTVIDLATDQPAWGVRFEAGVQPILIEANPDGSTKRIFVELSEFHGAVIVDFATHKEVGRIKLPELPFGSESGRADETTPCHGIAVAPDGKSLWINSVADNALFAYSLPDLRLLGYVSLPVRERSGQPPIGARPNCISFTPDSDRLFVSNTALDSVSVIDAATMKQLAVMPVGRAPKRSNTLVLR
jgi:YVTN family beta-propeller protein